uniref:Microtubule-associated protein futsch-like n=1 Tax=Saccoglossus kowalevskii TaxID=10224 RepID=A0ABM0M4Q9_SACKO|nr:PREDICTED: microtubule-associated protein futsch-like [Saccoglossus kowalevskii]
MSCDKLILRMFDFDKQMSDVESSVHILGRAQSITGADIGAIELEDGEPITGRYSGGDDYIVDTTQNIVDGSESGSTWIQPDMLEGVQEQESERTVEERDDDVHSASAPLSLPEDEDQWKGNQVDEERPKSTLSLGDSEKIHTTPVTSEKEMAEAPSQVESEKIKSAVGSQGGSRRESKGMWSVASSRPGSVQSGSRPGSEKAASRPGSVHAESQHGSVKTDSRPSSVKSEIRPSSVKSESRRSSVRATSVSESGREMSRQSSVKKLSELSSERPDNGSQPVSVAGEADVEGLEKIEIIMQPREASHITEGKQL